jgi:hypothetical protein
MSKIACGHTIATLHTDNGPMLVAAVPDGDDIEAGDEVIYEGNRFGFLTDKEGRRYHAAVIRRFEQSMR